MACGYRNTTNCFRTGQHGENCARGRRSRCFTAPIRVAARVWRGRAMPVHQTAARRGTMFRLVPLTLKADLGILYKAMRQCRTMQADDQNALRGAVLRRPLELSVRYRSRFEPPPEAGSVRPFAPEGALSRRR
jgi:hypothetical protein